MKPGIYYDLSAEEYHKDPCPIPSLSSSIAKKICLESPLHAKCAHPRLSGIPEIFEHKENFDIGTAAHSVLLEGDTSKIVVVEANDWRTKAARAARDQAKQNGLVPVLRKKWYDVEAMVDAIRDDLSDHNQAFDMFKGGNPEVTLIWEEDGVWCRARLDYLHSDHKNIDDYKTRSGTANPEAITRSVMREEGWDIQAAWYLRGLCKLTGEIDAVFRFAVQETSRPYPTSVVALGPDLMELAERKVEYAMRVWKECLGSGEWPGYPRDICFAQAQDWELARWEAM